MRTLHKIPKFASEQEEAEFWDTHDATDYLDVTEEVAVTFVDARPHKNEVSQWFDGETLLRMQGVAEKRGVSHQALIRAWVMEKLAQES